MTDGRDGVPPLPLSSTGMPAELVEEFPAGHKEAAERHEDCEDSPDWTEPMLLEMRMKENSRQDLRKSDGQALRKSRLSLPAGLLQNQLLAESARLNGQFSIARKASRNCPTQGPRGCKHRKKKTC